MTIAWLAVAIFVAVALAQFYQSWRISSLRKAGIYPKHGQAKDIDVLRLIQEKQIAAAIRCHREVHGSSLRQAKSEVERLKGEQVKPALNSSI
jgi:ribosomal protein L7/L12